MISQIKINLYYFNLQASVVRAELNESTTGLDRAELNGSCRAHPTGCRSGPSTARLMLQASLGPLPIVPGRARAEPNYAGWPTHLPRAKFSGLPVLQPEPSSCSYKIAVKQC
jgi:hypothetical protein